VPSRGAQNLIRKEMIHLNQLPANPNPGQGEHHYHPQAERDSYCDAMN